MWLVLAFASAVFAAATGILAKIGIKNTNPDLAMALRTIVVIVFAWLMVLIAGSHVTIGSVPAKSWVFLILSGLATSGAWICWFRALQLGDINKVVPINKSSTVLTMLLAFILLGEPITRFGLLAVILISAGTYFMIERVDVQKAAAQKSAIVYALLSALFASMTAILGKIGIQDVEANLGVAIRTVVLIIMSWLIVFAQGKHRGIKTIDRRSWLFIVLSGLGTGSSWLCYYRALQTGPASIVVPIDKLSLLIAIVFGYFVFGERLRPRSAAGLVMITAGTLTLLI